MTRLRIIIVTTTIFLLFLVIGVSFYMQETRSAYGNAIIANKEFTSELGTLFDRYGQKVSDERRCLYKTPDTLAQIGRVKLRAFQFLRAGSNAREWLWWLRLFGSDKYNSLAEKMQPAYKTILSFDDFEKLSISYACLDNPPSI